MKLYGLVFGALFCLLPPAGAATFTVTHTGDSGAGSLREAIVAANATPGADTIVFPGVAGTIALEAPLPVLGGDTSFAGPGAAALTVSGGGLFRIFEVPRNRRVVISRLRLAGGRAFDGQGGAILNAGLLIISECSFAGNRATWPDYAAGTAGGGAIATTDSLTVVASQFANNEASGGLKIEAQPQLGAEGYGGAIRASGSLTIAGCTFANNRSRGGEGYDGLGLGRAGGDAFGGALAVLGGSAAVMRSTFTANRAQAGSGSVAPTTGLGGDGGGSYGGAVYRAAGTLLMEDCVLQSNAAEAGAAGSGHSGGGIGGRAQGGAIASGPGAGLLVRGSTLVANSARGGLGGWDDIVGPSGPGGDAAGGGLHGRGEVRNCTFGQNSAIAGPAGGSYTGATGSGGNARGGGVCSPAGSLLHCTLTGNFTQPGAAGTSGNGGPVTGGSDGLATGGGFEGSSSVRSVLVAGNLVKAVIATLTNPSDANGTVNSLGSNLFGSSAGITGGLLASDLRDVAPLLDALQDNGGPTPTHALLPGSPALHTGDGSGAPATDQRGELRPQDVAPDIGAFEVSALAIVVDGKPTRPGAYLRTADATVTLQTTFAAGALRYTLDGSAPTLTSTPYTAPFQITGTATVRAAAFDAELTNPVFAGPVRLTFEPVRTLAVEAVGLGAVLRTPTAAAYPDGTTVTLTALPVAGWVFAGWSGDVTGTDATLTVTMDADKTAQATFIEGPHHPLTATPLGQGTITLDPPGGSYLAGTVVTLAATAAQGWTFLNWTGAVTTTNPSLEVTITGETALTAHFLNKDSDGDGLLDSWEFLYAPELTARNATDDTDSDGLTELQELAYGLNPLMPDAALAPQPVVEAGYLTITIARQPGATYEVQSAGTVLAEQPDSFSATTTVVLIDNATTLKVRDFMLLGTAPTRYLRVKVTAAP